jgi:tRNA(fMet)-specific endonuclease VapC
MPYLLDTNHCSYVINALRKKSQFHKPEEIKTLEAFRKVTDPIYTCDVVVGEMYFGAELRPNASDLYRLIDEFITNNAVVLVANKKAWLLFASTKAHLRKTGIVIEDFDLLIACIAKAYDCILVSNDLVFKHLPTSFQVENWVI